MGCVPYWVEGAAAGGTLPPFPLEGASLKQPPHCAGGVQWAEPAKNFQGLAQKENEEPLVQKAG